MSDAFLKHGPMNVVLTGWKNGAKAPYYPKAVANTRLVGRQIGLLVNLMVNVMGTKYDQVHLAGHSLGAHISGYAGAYLDGKIARITGLDPAGPFYEKYPTIVRLDKSDAKFVDAIHTNGAPLTHEGAGLQKISGHVDFYPNGGAFQPGCGDPVKGSLGQLFQGHLTGAEGVIACSHRRSYYFFTESINSVCPFTSYQCTDWDTFRRGECMDCSRGQCSQLGYHADQFNGTGKMYLQTLGASPYCGYQYRVTLTVADDSQGLVKIRVVGENGVSDVLELSEKPDKLHIQQPLQKIFITKKDLGDIKDVQVFYDRQERLLWGFVAGGDASLKLDTVTISTGEKKNAWTFSADQVEVTDDAWVSLVTKTTIKGADADLGPQFIG
ncbi:pancreatic triacylglycerol lipase [Lingula anatina]|uniref:Pancreatic triacylglycerol lipase n=1 Tax=Lingula anatina TaxID=7574 RepID=A0A1S3IYV8_LINAN|nr:pancreatic triacylglycerol lipase [Lingula anatina]|eukprot:XP_013403387.1 pancreatic triacylglycerol lipase [Lingula anatina]